ncbi:PREDICTED: sodium- and chloride-dependent neutral and basic amino acid transporter B(0+) isoform X1 [Lepidothrix coronata]|uniref:Transporter n=1 Tax=Lepidothrix coronata TaxID=321398 RepID=A0A6J0HMA0_9PASS|nr:PREDICTED: sodium- and chloride-dependent neutral and basic amino acid transporter B(0+) isoform X1 [Lepidothrix coronata]
MSDGHMVLRRRSVHDGELAAYMWASGPVVVEQSILTPWRCCPYEHPARSIKDFSLSHGKDSRSSDGSDGDENKERGNWSSKGDYLLSMVGYAVGLGNVWRFPYLTYQNGGGAFLIPYTLMLALAGLPLFFMECSLGQFASQGPIYVWRILPLFQGVGFTMVIISAFVSVYYNVIIAYAIYYLFASFQKVLPWSECFSWADEFCSKTQIVNDCNTTLHGEIIHANYTFVTSNNLTCINGTINYKPVQFPSEQYWNKVALQRSSGLDETGNVVWYLALCLLLAWMIVAAALFKGIKSSGKVVYFTALFPYVILLILLVRGATLEGAMDGIQYYIGRQSNFTKLMEAEVWKDAATQIFYSLSVAWGGLVALSSYNRFNNNCYSDAITVCVVNCVTSVFAGFAVFSILGHMAFVSQRPVSEVVNSGFNLAFVAYPEALSKLPVSPLWSFLFFFMLLLLGLDSQFASIETLTTTIQDFFPRVMKKLRIPVTMGLCTVLFLLGLICVTEAGIYWVNLIDHFCAGWGILFSAVLEVAGVVYIYGGNRFIQDIEMMIGHKSRLFWLWWRICWFFVTPALLMAILLWSLATFSPPSYGSVQYPTWGSAVGWCMIIFCVIWIPIVAIVKIVKAEGTLFERIASCCQPAANWGPYLERHRGERYSHMVDPKKEKEHEIPTVFGLIYTQ